MEQHERIKAALRAVRAGDTAAAEDALSDYLRLADDRTGDGAARRAGLQNFDWGVPQEWFQSVVDDTGENPSGHIVWSYDTLSGHPDGPRCTFGYPVAITEKGRILLGQRAQRV